MRRSEKAVTNQSEIDRIIGECQVLHLALNTTDYPYVVPLSFGYDGSHFYFHTAFEGRKIDLMKNDERVGFELESKVLLLEDEHKACKWSFAYQSVVGTGIVSEIVEDGQKQFALDRIMLHYSGESWRYESKELSNVRLWKIRILEISGKKSGV